MNSDDFRRLVAAGLSTDQIAVVMEMMDRDARLHAEAGESRLEAQRARTARYWERIRPRPGQTRGHRDHP